MKHHSGVGHLNYSKKERWPGLLARKNPSVLTMMLWAQCSSLGNRIAGRVLHSGWHHCHLHLVRFNIGAHPQATENNILLTNVSNLSSDRNHCQPLSSVSFPIKAIHIFGSQTRTKSSSELTSHIIRNTHFHPLTLPSRLSTLAAMGEQNATRPLASTPQLRASSLLKRTSLLPIPILPGEPLIRNTARTLLKHASSGLLPPSCSVLTSWHLHPETCEKPRMPLPSIK